MHGAKRGPPTVTRRGLLRAGGGALGTAAVGASATVAAGQQFGGWFDGVANYDGVVDRTGQDSVTVAVGVENGDGPYGFGPAAVRVSPGTTVTWEWTGEGGSHNVVSTDGTFESDLVADPGHTFEHTFEGEGVFRYLCQPHEQLGMKGAVVVGQAGGPPPEPDYGDWFDGVANFDGTVDRRDEDSVTVAVGVENGDGPYGFGPAAVRVSPGTTVTWEWTGEGGSHNVVSTDGTFESDLVADPGHTFEHTFEGEGVFRYLCQPHEQLGMKGAVVVGNVGDAGGGDGGDDTAGTGGGIPLPSTVSDWLVVLTLGSVGLGALAIIGTDAYLGVRDRRRREAEMAGDRATEAPAEEPAVAVEDHDPVGTLALVLGYLALIALLWVFMYFVEFLGGPSITG